MMGSLPVGESLLVTMLATDRPGILREDRVFIRQNCRRHGLGEFKAALVSVFRFMNRSAPTASAANSKTPTSHDTAERFGVFALGDCCRLFFFGECMIGQQLPFSILHSQKCPMIRRKL